MLVRFVSICPDALATDIFDSSSLSPKRLLYFCEGSKIIKYNINNQTKTTVARASNVSMLFIKSDSEIVYKANDNTYYVNNNSIERSTRIITDEYEYNSLFGKINLHIIITRKICIIIISFCFSIIPSA